MRIDHVIYSTADLDVAEAVVRDFGLDVVPGGVHEGLGTHNRIVPLGGAFLELLAIHDPAEAEGRGFGPALLRRGEGLLGWAAAVDDLAAVIGRLGLSTLTVSRQGMTAQGAGRRPLPLPRGVMPAGSGGGGGAVGEPYLPFFIERKEDRGPSRIDWLEV